MLTIASCLVKASHQVFIFWDPTSKHKITNGVKQRFNLDLSAVTFTNNIFGKNVSFLSRFLSIRNYDEIIYLSDGSIPFVFPKKLILHFQFPVEWVDGGNIKTKLKLVLTKKIICNSVFTKKFIDKKFGIDSTVLYPPASVRSQRLEVRSQTKENIILTVGRFGRLPEGNDFKKQDVMIKTLKKMVDNGFKDWEFIVVVSCQDRDSYQLRQLEDLIKGYPIKIIKNASGSELQKLYAKAKIYWHAAGFGEDLNKRPELAEHFGISTVEAMGAGAVPVVISAGGQKEIISDGKNGFLWDTLEELQEKTLRLVRDQNLWNNLSKEAKKRAQFFSNRRFCQELEKIIK